jgi:hypothetical protein
MAEGDRRSEHCLNCGHPVDDEFCPSCGQRNTHYRVSFWRLIGEALAEAFELDGRILRTIVPFLLRPGVLTREYVAGHRVTYSSPVRMFIFFTLVFFFTCSVVGVTPDVPDDLELRRTEDGNLVFSRAGEEEELAEALAEVGETLESDAKAGDEVPPKPLAEIEEALETDATAGDEQTSGAFREPLERLAAMEPAQAFDAFARSVLEHAPKVVFASVPIFALFLKLLYIRRRRFYFEHLVFSLHYFSFVMLAWTIAAIVGDDLLVLLTFLAAVVYLLLAMRTVYQQPWGKTATMLALLFV